MFFYSINDGAAKDAAKAAPAEDSAEAAAEGAAAETATAEATASEAGAGAATVAGILERGGQEEEERAFLDTPFSSP